MTNPCAEAAIGAGDDVLAADQIGVAHQALGDQIGVFDEIRKMADHAGYQRRALGYRIRGTCCQADKSSSAEAGFEVVGERNLGMAGSDAYSAAPPSLWRDTLQEMKTERADAYFVSCANIRAIDALDEMEESLNRPVLTSNQVVLWQALRRAGIDEPVAGLGRLLREPAAALAT